VRGGEEGRGGGGKGGGRMGGEGGEMKEVGGDGRESSRSSKWVDGELALGGVRERMRREMEGVSGAGRGMRRERLSDG